MAAAYFAGAPGAAAALTAALLAVFITGLFRRSSAGILSDGAVTSFGVLYLGWFAAHFCLLRALSAGAHEARMDGARLLLFVLAVTWICDTAAYAVGMAVGKHRLLPHASPKKSVEGGIAGAAAALAGALALRSWLTPSLGPAPALAAGLAIGVIGQAGDFAESLLKRDAGIKDTSRWLPGHGGILDRFDSLLVSVPAVYYLVKLLS
jgi:phosphatidate cytidylyltransferase